jgi:hypothetical protein
MPLSLLYKNELGSTIGAKPHTLHPCTSGEHRGIYKRIKVVL